MKISQLSDASGQPVSTIKFYIRQGLLPHGKTTAKNQADYDETHLKRLWLIGLLKDELGMSVDEMIEVFASLDAPGELESATIPVAKRVTVEPDAQEELLSLARDMGWLVDPADRQLQVAASHLSVFLRRFPTLNPRELLQNAARAMSELAYTEIELERRARLDSWDDDAQFVLFSVMLEPILLELRRWARAQRRAQLKEMQNG